MMEFGPQAGASMMEFGPQAGASMMDTLDLALDALRRHDFYREMAEAEARLRNDPAEWAAFAAERAEWLAAPLGDRP